LSFHEVSVAVRAENRTMGVFRTIASDVMHLGVAFGALDSQTGRTVMQIFSVIRLMTSFKAILSTTTAAQTAHNTAMGTGATIQTTLTGATAANTSVTWGQVLAQKAAAIATWLHAHGQLLLIGALTFGVGAIIAVTAALWAMAEANKAAAASTRALNVAMAESPAYTRGVRRAGEEEYYRRGVED